MNFEQFLEQRKPKWAALETLLDRAAQGLGRLSPAELDELGRLYRMVTSDLALAQRDFPTQQITAYLNQLAGRAHSVIYGSGAVARATPWEFYTVRFPRLYRAILPYTTVAFALFCLTALVAFAVVWLHPEAIYVLHGPQIAPLVRQVEDGRLWTEIPPAVRSAASATILTNNIQVTIITFAGGLSAGLFTAWILVLNGLSIGSLFGLLQAHGLIGGLGEFVAAHGPVELSIIFVAGGCGLYIGDGMLRPGLHKRGAVLVHRARQSVQIILGAAPLLFLSGFVEGYISPSGMPWPLKVAVGLTTGLALHLYWLRAGRAPRADHRAEHQPGHKAKPSADHTAGPYPASAQPQLATFPKDENALL